MELENVAGGHGGLCHDSKGREVVTLITVCVHGMQMQPVTINGEAPVTLPRVCGAGDTAAGTSNCRYLSYEKGIWYCNYNVTP